MKIKKTIIAILSIMLAALGVQLIVIANTGLDSISTFVLGLMKFTSLSFGQWSMIISFIFLMITFCVQREKIGIASLLYVIFLGGTLQITEHFAQLISVGHYGIVFALLGFALYGLGIASYLRMNLGVGPMEGIMYIIVKKLHVSIRMARIYLDLVINLLGFIMGGPIGLGTVFGIFCLGPLINYFLVFLRKFF